jgi:copper homeostasis protein
MIFEVCTDSVEGAIAAEKYGAKRIELCAALSVGGLTPNYGLIEQCVKKSGVEVHVIIRHKEGAFNYNIQDVAVMNMDISAAKRAGAHGVVFGILTDTNEISDLNKELVLFSKSLDLEVTFHRAFDFVSDYHAAMKKIIGFGFDRLLTSGLQPSAIEGLAIIQELQNVYGNEIQIMAGSGINADNALNFANIGIQSLHFSARKSASKQSGFSMGEYLPVDEDKIKNIVHQF